MSRLLGQLDERAVGQRVAADHLRRVFLVRILAVERHFDLRRALDDVVVRQDEAGLVDDEAGAGRLHDLVARLLALPSLALALALALAAALSEEPFEQVVAASSAATEELAQVLRPLARFGADVDNRWRDRLGHVTEGRRRDRAGNRRVVERRRRDALGG